MQAHARIVDAHASLGEDYVNQSVVNTDLVSSKLQSFSTNYDSAYSRYAAVIGAGRAEAQNQTLWRGLFLGIGTGVLAGVAAAYIAPSTAAGWFALTLADAGTAAGSSFLQATAASAVAYALSDVMTARGSNLQPDGLSPDVLRSRIWMHTASMYRGALATTRVLANLHKNNVAFARLIAEMRVLMAGGSSEYSAELVLQATDVMNARMSSMRPVFDGLSSKSGAMQAFGASVASYDPMSPTDDQMEKDIWILWMASLSDDDSDVLDLDAIEDHLHAKGILGRGSRLGVDFGNYTSEEDELAAIAAARRQAAPIRRRYDQAASRWAAPAL